jgi:hypothetical protein
MAPKLQNANYKEKVQDGNQERIFNFSLTMEHNPIS